ncbi:lipopolysaccharide biosynthesis protein [Marinobacter halotolerans]|uniref:lipopolysaccharide biosynthesis protein n=1 Tax=Marinobacter halotolerans TaxID=1569211 RepID=UPI001246BD3C|nr:oligosaccharide flippase family protein [Marinobacter halotolerans]
MNIKDIIGFAIGPIGAAILGLATTPLITWAFSPEDVGRFGVFQTVLSLVLVVSVFGLDQAYTREYHLEDDKARLFKNSVLPGFWLLLILSAGVMSFSELISEFLFGIESDVVIFLTVGAVVLNYFSRFLSLILRMQERGLAFSMSQIIPKLVLLAIVLAFIALPFKKTLIHLFSASVFSMVVVLLVFGWNTRRELKESLKASLDSALLRRLFRYGLPLVVAGLAFQAISAVTIFSLRTLSTFSELATYSVALRFSAAAVLVQSIFSIIWAPLVFKWDSSNVDMSRVGYVAQSVLAAICLFAAVTGCLSWLVDYLLPEDYLQVKYLIVCAMVQPLLYTLSIVTSVGIGLRRKNSLSLGTAVIALVANVLLCWLLTPRFGATGAVISNTLSFSLLFVLNTEASAFIWRGFPRTKMYICLSMMVGVAILTAVIGPELGAVIWIVWLLLGIASMVLFRKEITNVYVQARMRMIKA